MKLRGMVVGDLLPTTEKIKVKFTADPEEQTFEVICTFKPYEQRIRKYDICMFWIKWKSESYINEIGEICYSTHLICDKAVELKE